MNIQQLYKELFDLTLHSDTFYFQDFTLDACTYRIFNYRLVSYTEFLKPSALECRGIMFKILDTDSVELVSRPMNKFFNLFENPSTMDLDLTQVDTIEDKADGSLISTYMHHDKLMLKSKGSLSSEQALNSMKWLETQPTLYEILKQLDQQGHTTNLEWCAPHNRIVIGYPQAHLKILNVRHRTTGAYLSRDEMEISFSKTSQYLVECISVKDLDVKSFILSIPSMQDDIEGYICRIGNTWFKVKTEKYLSLHHVKDSINNPRRLFEAILDEGIDDMRSMFSTDQVAMDLISKMEGPVVELHNSLVATVEKFYTDNKDLDRKKYAIKGRNANMLDQRFFGLAMNKFLARPVDYKDFMKSKYKEFGMRDMTVLSEEQMP